MPQDYSNAVREVQTREAAAAARRAAAIKARPRLSRDSMMQVIDWTLDNADLLGAQAAVHMQAIELAIRTLATEAQGKATAHSDGTGPLA